MKKYLLILLLLSIYGVSAQADSLLSEKVDELKVLFDEASYVSIPFTDSSLNTIRLISNIEDLSSFPDRSAYLEKRVEQLEKDLGVDLYGGYAENFNLDPLEDIQQDINYRRRVQMGVRWDAIKGGYLENKLRAQIMKDKIEREKLNNDVRRESQFYLKRFDQTILIFNNLKINMLNQRLVKLDRQYKLVRELVYLQKIRKEELIKVEIRLAEVNSLINVYESYNDFLASDVDTTAFTETNLTLIDLNYDAIFNLIGVHTDSLKEIDNYSDYYKWYHEIGVSPYVRYNYYDVIDPALGDRSFFAAGVNFTVPLSFNTRLNNEVENEKWKYENQQFIQDRLRTHEEVLNTAFEFRLQLKRFVDLYQKRRLTQERLRIEKAKMRLNSTSGDPLKGLDLYDDLVAKDMDLIDVLQVMYLKALKIQTKIPGSKIDDIIKSKSTGDMYDYVFSKKRGVYIWKSTFENYSADFLAEYAVYNEFDKIIVSVSDKDKSEEKSRFLSFVTDEKEIYLMFGNNQLFYNKDIDKYIANVVELYPKINPTGVHLDIEPHTFEDWEVNRESILQQYLEMVKKVSVYCQTQNLKLEISVPKHYDKPIMDELFSVVDKVYFMCYENVKTDFLLRKLKPYIDENPDKVVVALRTEDFHNRLEMEDKIVELTKILGINEFVYHDLRRMIEFDKTEK